MPGGGKHEREKPCGYQLQASVIAATRVSYSLIERLEGSSLDKGVCAYPLSVMKIEISIDKSACAVKVASCP